MREEFVRTVATAVGLFASTEISLQRVLLSPVRTLSDGCCLFFLFISRFVLVCMLHIYAIFRSPKIFGLVQVLQLMNDSNQSVRDAAISCIEVS